MSDKLMNMIKNLSDASKVSEEYIIHNIKKSIEMGIATENEIEKLINKIVD
ncbi:hypothetical protein [Clostridium scatologenes]|uniref:Uncharacterized protein n=1 Tax=Clostridium scatologenes TaxID=1548 RepID=A0A0E3K1J9_CLOSL|nr:hypothetical protein [Clostridium scatologenes]AKA70064.1 hypothetical protein CSCA_2939 [Clostridium scatologenes]